MAQHTRPQQETLFHWPREAGDWPDTWDGAELHIHSHCPFRNEDRVFGIVAVIEDGAPKLKIGELGPFVPAVDRLMERGAK